MLPSQMLIWRRAHPERPRPRLVDFPATSPAQTGQQGAAAALQRGALASPALSFLPPAPALATASPPGSFGDGSDSPWTWRLVRQYNTIPLGASSGVLNIGAVPCNATLTQISYRPDDGFEPSGGNTLNFFFQNATTFATVGQLYIDASSGIPGGGVGYASLSAGAALKVTAGDAFTFTSSPSGTLPDPGGIIEMSYVPRYA